MIAISADEFNAVFEDFHQEEARKFSIINAIIDQISEMSGISKNDILGYNRTPKMVMARQYVMFKAHGAGLTLEYIGEKLNRHHTTVMYGIKAIEKKLQSTP